MENASRNRDLFPYFTDPRQGAGPSALLVMAKLHLLLFDGLVIQDNFFVSELFANARTGHRDVNFFLEGLRNGWMTVALRDSAESLNDLRAQLLAKAQVHEYEPFEGRERGIALYEAPEFIAYLSSLDTQLGITGAARRWSLAQVGDSFRDAMHEAAHSGSSGLPIGKALELWESVGRNSEAGSHNRTSYYALARQQSDGDSAAQIRQWADVAYLTTLPRALALDVSLSRAMLARFGAWDPAAEVDSPTSGVTDLEVITGRDCVLLNATFLESIPLSEIARLREFTEFTELTAVRHSGDAARVARAFVSYLKAIGKEAPRIADPRVGRLEARVQIKKGLMIGGKTLFSIVVALKAGPEAAAWLSGFSILLGDTHPPDDSVARLKSEVVTKLQLERRPLPPIGVFHHPDTIDGHGVHGKSAR